MAEVKIDEKIAEKNNTEVKNDEKQTFVKKMLIELEIEEQYQKFAKEEAVTWKAIKVLTEEQLKNDIGLKTGPRSLVFDYIQRHISAEKLAQGQLLQNPTAKKGLLDESSFGLNPTAKKELDESDFGRSKS